MSEFDLTPFLDRFNEALLLDLADHDEDEVVPIGRLLIQMFDAEEKGYQIPPGMREMEMTVGEIRNRARQSRGELLREENTTDYTIAVREDGLIVAHRPDCPAVERIRLIGDPLDALRDVRGELPPGAELHDCLREETMSTTDETVLCPRCERNRYMPYGRSRAVQGSGINEMAMPPALSRMDNATYICSECGTDEAMRDFSGLSPIAPSDWPLRFGFGTGSHTPKPID